MRYPLPKNRTSHHGRPRQIVHDDAQYENLNDNYHSQESEVALATIERVRTFIDNNLQYMTQIQKTQRKRQMVAHLNMTLDGIKALMRIVFILAASGALMVFGFRVFIKLLRIL